MKQINKLYILLLLIFPIINIFRFFPDTQFFGDTASLLVPALSKINGLGHFYHDYWEYKPPGIMFLVSSWAHLFGQSLGSFKLFHFISNILLLILIYSINKTILSKYLNYISTTFIAVVLFSPEIQTLLIASEIFGLLFSIIAVYQLLRESPNLYLSGLLFALSSQMKDPFAFTVISFGVYAIYLLFEVGVLKTVKNCLLFILGYLTTFILIILYLILNGALSAYLQVIMFKSSFVNLPHLFDATLVTAKNITAIITEYSAAPFLMILILLGFYLSVKKTKNQLIIIMYSIGSLIGLAAGKSLGSHYLIQIIFPFYITMYICICWIYEYIHSLRLNEKIKGYLLTLLIIITTIAMLPGLKYFKSYILYVRPTLPIVQTVLTKEDQFVLDNTSKDDCISVVYGWGTSEIPYKTRRKTCTRFFLTNIVLTKWQQQEYRDQIINNPPKAVIYKNFETDMNVELFEKDIFNWSKVLSNCYYQDKIMITGHLLLSDDLSITKECIINNLR